MNSQNLNPIILSCVIGVVAIGAGALAYLFPTTSQIVGFNSLAAKGHASKALDADQIQAGMASWNTPVMWQESPTHHRLFHSDEFLFYPSAYPDGDYIKRVDPNTRSPSGVPLSWYKKYGLDFTDPNVDHEDPDGDGFSNIVEFRNDPVGVAKQKAADLDGSKASNPLDPQSHPSYLARLRLQKFETRPFHIKFKGYQQLNGQNLFQVYLSDVPSYNQPPLKKTGDQLGFEGYTVGDFIQKTVDEKDPGTGAVIPTDESTLELDKPEINLKVIVPFRKDIDSPESTADFVMLLPSEVDKVVKVSRGKIFKPNYMPDSSFLVIDAGPTGATIRDIKTKQDYAIPKLDPAEWDEVPQPQAGTIVPH